jgi:hypothetical protein
VFTGGLVKRLEHEADHSTLSSPGVKKTGSIPPIAHTSSWRDISLIKHTEEFNFHKYGK